MKHFKYRVTREEQVELDQAFNEETHVFRKFIECFLVLVYLCYFVWDLADAGVSRLYLFSYLLLFILVGTDLCLCLCYRKRMNLAGRDCERWFRSWSCAYGALLLTWGEYANILEAKDGRPETVFLTVVILTLCGIRYTPRVQLGLFSLSFGVNFILMVIPGQRFLTTTEKLNYLLFFITIQYVGVLLFRSTLRTLRARRQDRVKAAQLQEANQELSRLNADLQTAAHMDGLTGLGNRLRANRILKQYWEENRPFTIAFIDLDHLKYCNDHYGHGEGDCYIRAVSFLLSGLCEKGEELFRIGGDEFLLISETTDRIALETRLEKARTEFGRKTDREPDYPRSFSYGCAERCPGTESTYSELLSEADQRMYRYKMHQPGRWEYAGRELRTIVDPVTGLGNVYELSDELQRMKEKQDPVTLLMIGIDSFGMMNHSYDYEFGNRLLCCYARLLQELTEGQERVYRMDGAKFVVLFPEILEEAGLQEFYQKAAAAARDQVQVERHHVALTIAAGSIAIQGVAIGEAVLLSGLSYALRLSKTRNEGRLVVYSDSAWRGDQRKIEMIDDIKQSILQGCQGFFMQYQPQVDGSGAMIGAEALLRWQNKKWGLVSPEDFIPVLENDRSFYDLGCWILRTSLTEIEPMLSLRPDFQLSVNVSYHQLNYDVFRNDVAEILQETGFPPERLTLELTEHQMGQDMDRLREQLLFFRSLGIRIAADDFGIGYSTLAILRDLPFDDIKLDRSFTEHAAENPADRILVSTAIECARKFNIRVCVEGVDTRETMETLRAWQPDSYQGYLFSRPLSAEGLMKYCGAAEE